MDSEKLNTLISTIRETNASEDPNGFHRLAEALLIFSKYSDTSWPTHCEHDQLSVMCSPDKVSDEDMERLDELGFMEDGEYFYSYRFGSA